MAARDNFVAWLVWYKDTRPEEVPTWTEMAHRIGVVKSAISQLIAKDSKRMPSLPTLMGAAKLTGWDITSLLTRSPPKRRS